MKLKKNFNYKVKLYNYSLFAYYLNLIINNN